MKIKIEVVLLASLAVNYVLYAAVADQAKIIKENKELARKRDVWADLMSRTVKNSRKRPGDKDYDYGLLVDTRAYNIMYDNDLI